MKRAEILEQARVCVTGEREQDYGSPEDSFENTGLLWGVYLRAAHPDYAKVMPINGITPKDVAVMLGCLKVARIARGDKADSFVDLAGYAACAGEIATQKEIEPPNFIKENQCVICGEVIPEGRQVCPTCEAKHPDLSVTR